MVVDFPDSPSINDEFTHPQTGTIYIWTGAVWNLKYSASGAAPIPDATDSQKGLFKLPLLLILIVEPIPRKQ